MKKLVLLLSVVAALFVAPTAQAETYTHYVNCGTGAYVVTVYLTWNGYSWNSSSTLQQIWGRC
jgi:hypothetical protein